MRKRTDFSGGPDNTRKQKLCTEPCQVRTQKENFVFKSVCDSDAQPKMKPLEPHKQENDRTDSKMVSPTFQSLSLKDQIYRADTLSSTIPDYPNPANLFQSTSNKTKCLNIGFSLRDLERTNIEERYKVMESFMVKLESKCKSLEDQVRSEKERCSQMEERLKQSGLCWQKLEEHYRAKDYWDRLEKMLKDEDKDISLMKELQYVTSEHAKQRNKRKKKEEEVKQLQGQLQAFKKQLKTALANQQPSSPSKCRKCDNYQRECTENYAKVKELIKRLEEETQNNRIIAKQLTEKQEKYTQLKILHEEVERKRREIAKSNELFKLRESQHSEAISQLKNDILHLQQLNRQFQDQSIRAQQACNKEIARVMEQHKGEIDDIMEKIEEQKSRAILMEGQRASIEAQFKERQWQAKLEAKLELMKRDMNDNHTKTVSGLSIQNKQLLRSISELKQQLEARIQQQLKKGSQWDAAIKQRDSAIKERDCAIKEKDSTISTLRLELKQNGVHFSEQVGLIAQKERELTRLTQELKEEKEGKEERKEAKDSHREYLTETRRQNVSIVVNKKMQTKIRQCIFLVRQLSEAIEVPSKRRGYEQTQEEGLEKSVLELAHDLSEFANKCKYLAKDNEILHEKLLAMTEFRESERQQSRREIKIKEEAMKSLASFIPEQLKDITLDFLCATEALSRAEDLEEDEVMRYEELRIGLEGEGREWKEGLELLERKVKKIQQENDQLRRRLKGGRKQSDFEEGINKKQIRKRYEL